MTHALLAGAAVIDITPQSPQFLFGYPHVPRQSTGVHDPLLCTGLYLKSGVEQTLILACDLIFVDRRLTQRVRARLECSANIPSQRIMLTATHTHSGPVTVDLALCRDDTVVPRADVCYLRELEDSIVAAGKHAKENARHAEFGVIAVNGSCLGGNRHTPEGPCDPHVPVLAVRERNDQSLIALLLITSMHPTVLHEDSTLFSADFPGMTRTYLQTACQSHLPILHLTGPCGNQSPRHVVRSNTFAEATRLGTTLGKAVQQALPQIEYSSHASLSVRRSFATFPQRSIPCEANAEVIVAHARQHLEELRQGEGDAPTVRTAECRLFGAEETLTLARLAKSQVLQQAIDACMPAEIALLGIGQYQFLFWPGEVFVEFALELKEKFPNVFIVSLANGELQGYVVTDQAVRGEYYEALNALFASPESGRILVEHSARLLTQANQQQSWGTSPL